MGCRKRDTTTSDCYDCGECTIPLGLQILLRKQYDDFMSQPRPRYIRISE